MYNIDRVSYILTQSCNLSCPFCFEFKTKWDGKILSKKDIINFTKYIVKKYTFDKQSFKISLIGGEPMLFDDFNIFKDVIKIYEENNIKISKFVTFTNNIYINSTFIDLLSFLKEKNIGHEYVLTPNLNDDYAKNRLFNDYDILKYNKNKEYIEKKSPETIIREYPVLDKTNIDMYPKLLRENNIMLRYCEYISKEKNFTKEDTKFMANSVIDLIEELNLNIFLDPKAKNIVVKSGLKYLKFLLYENVIGKRNYQINNCYPFVTEIAIDPHGFIVPCSRVLGLREHFEYPNINDDIKNIDYKIDNLKKSNSIDINEDNEKCDECPLNQVCQTCKMISDKISMNGYTYVNPKEKCEYELMQFNAIYEVLKERVFKESK